MDHAGAFADATKVDGFAGQFELERDFLGAGVAGHDGLDGMTCTGGGSIQQGGGMLDSVADIVHRQGNANAARGGDENLRHRDVQGGRGETGHGLGIEAALEAGAGVGVAGIDDNGASEAAFGDTAAKANGGGANLVGGEGPCNGGGSVGKEQGQIAFLAFVGAFARAEAFDVAKDAGGKEARGGGDGTGNGLEWGSFQRIWSKIREKLV